MSDLQSGGQVLDKSMKSWRRMPGSEAPPLKVSSVPF